MAHSEEIRIKVMEMFGIIGLSVAINIFLSYVLSSIVPPQAECRNNKLPLIRQFDNDGCGIDNTQHLANLADTVSIILQVI